MASLMIYGATGYTGGLICEQAKKAGLSFSIAGRSQRKLKTLASALEVSYQAFDLAALSLDVHLQGTTVLLNCAGPFARTARVLMAACIRCKIHYLDVSAELDGYLVARKLSEEAREAGVMLLPGCGGSVAMLGYLAAHAIAQSKASFDSLDIALTVAGSMSRGSANSAAESAGVGLLRLRNGGLVQQDTSHCIDFDFGDGRGPVSCSPVTLPDLITLHESTSIANIQTFVNASIGSFPSSNLASLPNEPSMEERAAAPYRAAVAVEGGDGERKRAVLHTVNGYTFTALASVEAARRVLRGELKPDGRHLLACLGRAFLELCLILLSWSSEYRCAVLDSTRRTYGIESSSFWNSHVRQLAGAPKATEACHYGSDSGQEIRRARQLL